MKPAAPDLVREADLGVLGIGPVERRRHTDFRHQGCIHLFAEFGNDGASLFSIARGDFDLE